MTESSGHDTREQAIETGWQAWLASPSSARDAVEAVVDAVTPIIEGGYSRRWEAQVRADERERMEDRDQRFAHCEHCPEGCDEEHSIACNYTKTPLCVEGSRRLT